MAVRESPEKRWFAERDAAQAMLGTYNTSVAGCLPAALSWMVTQVDAAVNKETYSFALADALQKHMSGVTDPVTKKTLVCPLGKDVAFAVLAAELLNQEDIRDVRNACSRTEALLRRMALSKYAHRSPQHSDSLVSLAADVEDGTTGMRQIVIPMVFGALTALSPRDLDDVWMHIQRGDEVSCNKLLSSMCKTERPTAVQFGSTGRSASMRLSASALKSRMEAARAALPVVFYKAVCSLGLVGPRFFAAPPQIPHYPFSHTLPHAYAGYLKSVYEDDE
jgi:hypothetical protein